MSHIQSIIFNKKYWTFDDSENWIDYHGFLPSKRVHETHDSYRYRLVDPSYFKRFRSKKLDNGITFVIGFK